MGSETSADEYSTRRIQFHLVYFCSDPVFTCSKIERPKFGLTNIDQANLDSPRQELSNGGLGIVVCSPYGSFGKYSLLDHIGRPIQLDQCLVKVGIFFTFIIHTYISLPTQILQRLQRLLTLGTSAFPFLPSSVSPLFCRVHCATWHVSSLAVLFLNEPYYLLTTPIILNNLLST